MNQTQYRLETEYNEKGPFGKIGAALNSIGKMINGLHYSDEGDILTTPDFIRLSPQVATPRGAQSFDLSARDGAAITISPGYINYHAHNDADVLIDETEMTLTGGPFAWAYAVFNWDDYASASVEVASGLVTDRPRTDGSQYKRVLWEFEYDQVNAIWLAGTDRRTDLDIVSAVAHS